MAIGGILLICLVAILETTVGDVKVRTEEGYVLGRSAFTNRLKKPYFQFKGIPYAEPPKRFQVSVPKRKWSGILNCTYDKSECVQGNNPVTGSEDCLFLSVYSGNLTGEATVMVWIHGGRFTVGNASYDSAVPDYFLDEDLIVVQIQYRLGIFGFMSTGDEFCPGNFGLKDQLIALQWVNRNIRNFGGDPNKVTIFGESAGGVSVSLHLMSNRSKGLFQRAVMNSGVSLCLWSLTRNSVSIAYKVAGNFGVNSKASTWKLIQQLKKADYKKLQQKAHSILPNKFALGGLAFAPVIEPPHPNAFLSGKSDQLLSAGYFNKIPILLGLNSNESVFQTTSFSILGIESKIGLVLEIYPKILVPADITSDKNLTEAGEKILHEFWGDEALIAPIGKTNKFINVDQYARPINRFVKNVCKYDENVYYYRFSYVGQIPDISTTGVAHADELHYLFKPNTKYSAEDERMTLRAVKMWSNFCKFGKPIPFEDPLLENATWRPACSTTEPFFLFNIDSRMGRIENPYSEELNFYDEKIYGVYGQGIYDTY